MTLAQLSFKKDLLTPINQMWTINLTVGQLASGSSAQPFKTVDDYNKWLHSKPAWLRRCRHLIRRWRHAHYVYQLASVQSYEAQSSPYHSP